MKRRLLALFLSVMMILSLAPASVFAEESEEPAENSEPIVVNLEEPAAEPAEEPAEVPAEEPAEEPANVVDVPTDYGTADTLPAVGTDDVTYTATYSNIPPLPTATVVERTFEDLTEIIPPMPEANVTAVDPMDTNVPVYNTSNQPTGETVGELGVEYKFTPVAPTQAQIDYYGTWHADYRVTFNADIDAGTFGLYGAYGNFARAYVNPKDIHEGDELFLLDAFGLDGVTYNDVLTDVQEFICGAFNLSEDNQNAGKVMTVELVIWQGEDNSTAEKIVEQPYTFADLTEIIPPLSGILYAYSLTLEDAILINEQIFFPNDANFDVSKFVVKSVFNGVTTTTTLSDDLKVSDDREVNGKHYTVYKVLVADCFAKQMIDDAVITFTYNGKTVMNDEGTVARQYTVSIRSYCEGAIEGDYDAKLKTLCRAVLSYGAEAQTRFNYKTDDLANKTYSVENPSTEIPVSYQKQESSGSCSAVQGAAISLVLESRTLMHFYIMPVDGYSAADLKAMLTVKLGDTVVTNYRTEEVTADGPMKGALLVTITGIMAKNLADVYAVSVGNDTCGTRTYYQSPLNYAFDAQTKMPAEKALVLALYDYYLQACNYLQNNNG